MSVIRSFKMRGGDEVVAEVVDEVYSGGSMLLEGAGTKGQGTLTHYVLRRPHILRFMPVGPGQSGLVFIPWTLSNPTIERMPVPVEEAYMVFDPSANVERQYIEQTSGIAQVPPGTRISK
jgi:hypothetical protein